MRNLLIVLLLFFSTQGHLLAQVKSEGELIESLMRSLQTKDSRSYIDLFPQTDTIESWVLQYADRNSDYYRRMLHLKDDYNAHLLFDSSIREEAEKGFEDFLRRGNALGVHWDQLVFIRYELEKLRRGRDLITEKISQLRFLGYVFVKDMLSRKTYAFTIFDIMEVNGLWYGGELSRIFRASNKEEYQQALAMERKKERLKELGLADTSKQAAPAFDEDADNKMPRLKEIVDRKFYVGKFDNEITVQLYVRYVKGNCPEIACSWEALFKFGDQDEYVLMEVSRTHDGNWLFSEDLGGMELKLDGKHYTGSYASASDKTEYEVKFVETDVPTKQIQMLDEILDSGAEDE